MKHLRIVPAKTKADFLGKKWLAFSVSIIMIIITIGALVTKGLNLGIDFTGGVVIEIRTEQPVKMGDLREYLSKANLGEVALQSFGTENDIMIRFGGKQVDSTERTKAVDTVKAILAEKIGTGIDYRKVDFVGPQVGEELIKAGILSLILAFIAMMIYIWFRFEWQFGVGAIVALIHDAFLTIGLFSLSGMEFNLTSIAAILTIVGYSINDTVVIYDRIRECMRKYKKMPLEELLNISINETLSRTILTSGTTFVAVIALVWFGGDVIRGFSIAMLFGIIIGTYSSIYIAAPLLIFMNVRREESPS